MEVINLVGRVSFQKLKAVRSHTTCKFNAFCVTVEEKLSGIILQFFASAFTGLLILGFWDFCYSCFAFVMQQINSSDATSFDSRSSFPEFACSHAHNMQFKALSV